MVGPSSQISKLLLAIFILVICFFIFMDYSLYVRIQYYALNTRDYTDNVTSIIQPTTTATEYKDVAWIGCELNPLCDVTVKAVLLDHTNYFLFAPLVTIVDKLMHISQKEYITPNMISVFHVFVAILAAKCISSHSLSSRRVGALLFELRTFLDDLDGHVARARKHIKGERSEVGTSGYYIDGLCDALGCTALMIGVFVHLKNNPPRRGYVPLLPTLSDIGKEQSGVTYKSKVTTNKVMYKVAFFSVQLFLSSLVWNRYIAFYQSILEKPDASQVELAKELVVFRSTYFFAVTWLWRVFNVHNTIHFLLLLVFCDKLWEFLCRVQYIGFGILLSIVCVTELNIMAVKRFIYNY